MTFWETTALGGFAALTIYSGLLKSGHWSALASLVLMMALGLVLRSRAGHVLRHRSPAGNIRLGLAHPSR